MKLIQAVLYRTYILHKSHMSCNSNRWYGSHCFRSKIRSINIHEHIQFICFNIALFVNVAFSHVNYRYVSNSNLERNY